MLMHKFHLLYAHVKDVLRNTVLLLEYIYYIHFYKTKYDCSIRVYQSLVLLSLCSYTCTNTNGDLFFPYWQSDTN